VRLRKRHLGLVLCSGLACAVALGGMVAVQAAAGGKPIARYTTKGAWSFVSEPKLHPPKLAPDISVSYRKLAGGDFFLTNFRNVNLNSPMVGQSGPMILDNHLRPVWFLPIGTHLLSADLKLQTYNGKPALSWWQGTISRVGETLSGQLVLVDNTYKQVAKITAPSPWVISLHDAVVQGTNVWVTVYRQVSQSLTKYHGPAKGTVLDSAFQEYDLKTGKLLYTWDALGHIPLSDSYASIVKKTPWDAYHVNSLQLVSSNEMLVSMRNTWAAYLVDTTTGKTIWTLGGKHSSFKPKTPYHFQHDVELHHGDVVSAFDDNCCNQTGPSAFDKPFGPSRGVVLKLDFKHHTVSQSAQYKHGTLVSAFLGNTQLLSNGNVVIGWGSQPLFSEYSRKGKLLDDVKWPSPDQSYRAYVEKWTATPYFPPSGAVKTKSGRTTVYASWDGATEVASWEVMGGSSATSLKVVAKAGKSAFETAIALSKSYKFYKVLALDKQKKVLGTSSLFPTTSGPGGGFY